MLDAGDDGPGIMSTNSCNIATRTHDMERECSGRIGMEYVYRLGGSTVKWSLSHGSQYTGTSMRAQQVLWLT